MITLQNWDIPTRLDEMTLKQYLKITEILNDNNGNWIGKYFSILEILKVPDAILDLITDKDLFDFVNELNNNDASQLVMLPEITINGETFVGYTGSEFTLKARDMLFIEQEIVNDTDLKRIVAIIFKSTNTGITDHRSESEIERKALLFEQQPANLFIPYLIKVTSGLIEKIDAANGK